jgi:chemotaxis protein methyltransferase CheR
MQLLSEPPFECVFICNVLIYFDRDSKQVVLNNLLDRIAVGGYLVVGPSEGVAGMLKPLQKISPLVYRKVDDTPLRGSGNACGDAQP